ncbi:hypothetical protein GCT13_42735 [Paraburkholderia sp. CNPSo 3157]|uniref:Uncharacterized protein n=1 Tax=Paraburkholderia franconis TaxID=2654983 RepID=A0A7X1NKV1_9BURK|nr:hypothetical protein [Paraburkholderia franconis]MPW23303.1 hypothetical protein [Paraburkholderia franconis]
MSQARRRYAGSRDSGQRQPRHEKKSPANRQGRPYVKAPPRDTTDTASIFKTRSFRFLVDAVGAENIAIALESSMTRVTELMNGERFTPETAFHMETALGLPHGFFDQPNPALADATIARLKSPLDFVQIDEGFDAESEALEPAPARTVDQPPVPEDSLSKEAQMPKKVAGGSPRAVKNSRIEMPEPLKAPRLKDKTSIKTPQQQPLALSDGAELENIRRANLRLLTSRNGSKVRLGVVMEMSGFNIADRLYGKKRMDAVEANRFTERLGLPAGWLDTPRSEGEIPGSVSHMLAPAPRGRVSGKEDEPLAADAKLDAQANVLRISDDPLQTDTAKGNETRVVCPQQQVYALPGDHAGHSLEANGVVATAEAPANPESPSVSGMPQQMPAPLAFAPVTSLENLHGIGPIAEALLKTLAGKARTGRLDELKALELLQQAVLL